jgi:hypothetical protein
VRSQKYSKLNGRMVASGVIGISAGNDAKGLQRAIDGNCEIFCEKPEASARGETGYKSNTIGHPAHAGTAPCPPLHAQRKRILMRAGKREQSPNSTTRATPSARCSTKPLPRILRPGLSWPEPVSSTARATTTPPSMVGGEDVPGSRPGGIGHFALRF